MLLLACCAYRKIKVLFISAYTAVFGGSGTEDPIELINKRYDDARSLREQQFSSTAKEAVNLAFQREHGKLQKFSREDQITANLELEQHYNQRNRLAEAGASSSKPKRRAPKMPSKWWSTNTLQAQELANRDDSFANNRLDQRPVSVQLYDDVPMESSSGVEIEKDGSIEIQLE